MEESKSTTPPQRAELERKLKNWVDQGERFTPLRFRQVVQTHQRMLLQFAALQDIDHAGER
jgi:hypothetical protein